MALNNTHTTSGQYQDVLNNHIKEYENAELASDKVTKLDAHFEGTSMAFGYGYDLFQRLGSLKTELSAFVSHNPSKSSSVSDALQQVYDLIDANTKLVNGKRVFSSTIFLDADKLALEINSLITLSTEANATLLLTQTLQEFETSLDQQLTVTLADSNERVAVIGQLYRLGKGGAPSMIAAINAGNRAEAWFEIRYNSNSDLLSGNYTRVVKESNLFSLYDNNTPTEDEAKTVLRMHTKYKDWILAEEAKSPTAYSGTNSIQNQIANAKTLLIANFSHGQTIDGEVLVGAGLELYEYDEANPDDLTELSGGQLNDLIFGELGDDKLEGNAGNDVLIGGEGDDILDGGTGNDTMLGGKDNDTYYVDSLLDAIVENAGEGDADTLISSIDYALTDGQHENIEHFALDSRDGGSGLLLAGNESDNILAGNQLDNIILGGGGADTLYGGDGADHLEAGEEDVYGEGAINVLQGGKGNDTLLGGLGIDLLYGGTGDDTLFVDKGGIHVLSPLEGYKLGTEVMNGGEGFDTYYVGTFSNYAIIEDSDGQGEVYVKADGIGDKTYKLTGGVFWGEQTITPTGLPADGYTLIHADGTASQLTVAYEGDGSQTLLTFGIIIPNFYNGMLGINLVGGRVDTDFHPVEQVLEKITFDEQFSPDEVERIKSVIRDAYEQSPIARKMFNDFTVAGGNNININFSENGFSSSVHGRDPSTDGTSSGEPGLSIDLNWLENNTYISTNGKAVKDTLEAALIHELVHLMTGLTDEGNSGEAGPTVEFANSIYQEMGIAQQASYSAYDATGNTHTTNFEYTQGQAIDRAFTLLSENSDTNDLDSTEGGILKDLIIGNERDNVINGGDGNDYLYGGDGNDTLKGDKGWGGHEGVIESHDVLFGEGGDDILEGGEGNDVLYGGSGNDKILGGRGNDQLTGGKGNDLLDGEVGYNKYIFSKGDGQDTIGASIYRSSSDELVFTSEINPTDVVFAREGIDLVFRFLDTDDQITIRGHFETSGGWGSFVQVTFANGVVWTSEHINSSLLQGTEGDDNIVGYGGDDVINGQEGNDVIEGQKGHDTISGGSGDDILKGQGGNDRLDGGIGNDTLDGGYGNDILTGGKGDDIIKAGDGINTIYFARGDGQDSISAQYYQGFENRFNNLVFADDISTTDVLLSRDQNSLTIKLKGTEDSITVDGYFLFDDDRFDGVLNEIVFSDGTKLVAEDIQQIVMQGTEGDDSDLVGTSGDDVIDGKAGDDNIRGEWGNDTLIGGLGNDTVAGGWGDDIITGGEGDDILSGDNGEDVLTGGLGNDELHGGHHNDTYVFSAGDGQDVIDDYSYSSDARVVGLKDKINFVNINFSDVHVKQVDNDLVITFSNSTDRVTVRNQFMEGTSWNAKDTTFYSRVEIFTFADGIERTIDDLLQESLKGTDADDVINGFDTADTINAGLGDDNVDGKSGNDVIHGNGGNDTLKGGAGDDQLFGDEGNDILEGGTGKDTLDGGAGDDILISFDDIYDKSGKTLIGGKGNDTLYGSFGDDTYIFNLGDGADTIIERRQGEAYSNVEASNDTLQFGEGIAADDLTFARAGNDLQIRHSNGTDSITVQNWFAGSAHYQLNLLTFADGTALTVAQIEAQLVILGTEGNDSLLGSAQVDEIYGEAGDDYIDGRAGDDTLYGGDGNDTLVGGAGNDLLLGGTGDDKYVYNPQTGLDTIDNTGGGFDGVFFTNGIDVSRLSFSQDGDDLVILVDGDDTQSVRVLNHFLGGDAAISYVQPSGGNMITAEQIAAVIAGGDDEEPVDPADPVDPVDPTDPTEPVDPGEGEPEPGDNVTPGLGGNDNLSGTTANDVLLGGAGDDVLIGLAGNDRLFGGVGSDTYIYHSGQDVITEEGGTDKLIFSNGITFNQVASGLTKSGNDLILKVNGSSANSVTLTNFFLGGGHLVESFEFETGGSISAAQIFGAFGLAMPSGEAPAVNAVRGTAGNDTLNGSAAADVLSGSHGNDTLNGGAGNDTLLGGRGNDTYVFSAGSGHDTIDNSGGGEDVLLFEGISFNQVASGLMKSGNDLVLNIGGGSDKVTIKNWFLGGDYVVPTLRFAAGGEISANQIFGAFGLANPDPQGSLVYTDLPDERAFGNVFVGTAMDETVVGSSDDDFIDAGNGNDTLNGGAGNDYLLGGRGNDTYLFCIGGGQDVINNFDPNSGKDDRLLLGAGINKAEVQYYRAGDNLVLQLNDSSDSVTVQNWFVSNDYQLSSVVFADGQQITAAEINTTVSALTEPSSAQTLSVQSSPFTSPQMKSYSANAFENDNGVVSSTLTDELLQHRRSAPEQNMKMWLRKQLGKAGSFVSGSSRREALLNDNELPQAGFIAEFKGMTVTDKLEQHMAISLTERSRPAGMLYDNERPQSALIREFADTVSTTMVLPQRFRMAKGMLLNEVEAQHASLVDALNAFDATDDAALDGNFAVAPTLEQHYY